MSEETQFAFDELSKKYPFFVGRAVYAEIIDVSISTVANRVKAGYGLPPYRREGDWKNAKIIFNLRDIAEFMTGETVKTA